MRLLYAVLRAAVRAGIGEAAVGQSVTGPDDTYIDAIAAQLRVGLRTRVLQSLPHMVLLDVGFYHTQYAVQPRRQAVMTARVSPCCTRVCVPAVEQSSLTDRPVDLVRSPRAPPR